MLLILITGSSFFCVVYLGFFGRLPNKDELEKISHAQSSIIKDIKGKKIGKFYFFDRTSVKYEQLPKHLIHALIATEDNRYYSHHGLDYRSWLRVFLKTIVLQQRSGGGGSTISQQLAKNLYPREKFTKYDLAISKIKEMITAYRLESVYSKEEILILYLNTVSFPGNTFGIESAANKFFSKSATSLSVQESATLIGSLKANHSYNPRLFPERSENRRNTVLALMKKHGYLSENDFSKFKNESIHLVYDAEKKKGHARYFIEQVRQKAKNIIKANNLNVNLYTDGLKIYTSLDLTMQSIAEKSVKTHLMTLQSQFENNWGKEAIWLDKDWRFKLIVNSKVYKKWESRGLSRKHILQKMKEKYEMEWFEAGANKTVSACQIDSIIHYTKLLNAGSITLDGHSGAIRTWIGGVDYNSFKYDHVNQSKRQVGSVFKPFVYATALESGFSPCDHIEAKTITYKNFDNWTPHNDSDEYEDKYLSMRAALSKSVNTVAVKLMEDVGVDRVIELAHKAGIESDLPRVPSLALGTAELSIIELAKAYTIFTNNGTPLTPYFIEYIEDQQGNIIYKHDKTINEQVIDNHTYVIMQQLLQSVTESGGTASRLKWKYKLDNDLSGKTGTTQSNRDGWFIAVTPNLVSINWVGSDNYSLHFKDTRIGQGANSALPIFGEFYSSLNKLSEFDVYTKATFKELPTEWQEELDCELIKEVGFIKKIFQKEGPVKKNYDEENDEPPKQGVFKKLKKLFRKKK